MFRLLLDMHQLHGSANLDLTGTRGRIGMLVFVTLAATVIDIASALALARLDLAPAAKIAVAFLPVPANVTLLVLILRGIRKLDEFQKRQAPRPPEPDALIAAMLAAAQTARKPAASHAKDKQSAWQAEGRRGLLR